MRRAVVVVAVVAVVVHFFTPLFEGVAIVHGRSCDVWFSLPLEGIATPGVRPCAPSSTLVSEDQTRSS